MRCIKQSFDEIVEIMWITDRTGMIKGGTPWTWFFSALTISRFCQGITRHRSTSGSSAPSKFSIGLFLLEKERPKWERRAIEPFHALSSLPKHGYVTK